MDHVLVVTLTMDNEPWFNLFLNGLDGISGASNPVLTLPHNSPGTPAHDGDERRGQSLH